MCIYTSDRYSLTVTIHYALSLVGTIQYHQKPKPFVLCFRQILADNYHPRNSLHVQVVPKNVIQKIYIQNICVICFTVKRRRKCLPSNETWMRGQGVKHTGM